MRHQVAGFHLGRNRDSRASLRRTLINQLFTHERIETTHTKALAIRGDAERLITLAKNSSEASDIDKVNARRQAAAQLGNAEIVKKLFDDIAPRFKTRSGGYTRMVKTGPRLGDAAEMVIIELVEG
ncbi:50S ribosomal protein L17 [Leptolinea tardivitalis]|uniref:Large ribosomal subunit protein bL17 n=1 Tax=Leptolinea tardivitalis TaxID=229920 RepID=A0A0N8GL53_9CHLR|nr:50S ribosomal protein L17 [Leptolinea tardivitalis]KPL71538.1 50S ribosomal protein L17 [Leptolinea tardivitalis]GAP19847.1 LSU ribosomal protein L17P [Leptolinea tardivitalis]